MGCCQLSSRTPSDTSVPPSPISGGLRCPLSIRQESALGSPPWVHYHEKPRDKCQKEKEKTRKYQKDLGQDSWSDAKSLQKWCQQSGLNPAPDSQAGWQPSARPTSGSREAAPAPLQAPDHVSPFSTLSSGHNALRQGSLKNNGRVS